MSRSEKPDFEVLNLKSLFQEGFMKVPKYQREYAWSTEEITSLLTDISDFIKDEDPYYLMGQVVLVALEDSKPHLEIVDGQQRLTSLFLLFIAIKHKLNFYIDEGTTDDDIKAAFGEIRNILVKKNQLTRMLELRLLPANNSFEFLNSIFENEVLPVEVRNETEKNLKNNYEQIKKSIDDNFESPEALFNLYEKLSTEVFVVCLTVSDLSQALAIFEKMNDRGMPLNSADLLKNLLFQNAEPDDYQLLSEYWEEATDSVFRIKSPRSAASMDFLLKALLAGESGKSYAKKRVFREWRDIFKAHPVYLQNFGPVLKTKAQKLNDLSRRIMPKGRETSALYGTWFSDASQQFTVLLAGNHLNSVAYEELCRIVDSRFMISSLSGERTQYLEVLLAPWSHAVEQLPEDASIDDVRSCSPWNFFKHDLSLDVEKLALLEEETSRELTELFNLCERGVGMLSYRSSSDRKKIKYVLARVAVVAEEKAENNLGDLWNRILRKRGVKIPKGKGFELEHVMPRSAMYRGGNTDDGLWIDSIGNLVPMIPIDNATAGKSSPASKKNHYLSSELILTKSLCSARDLAGFNERHKKVFDVLKGGREIELEAWGSEAVELRKEAYWQILKEDLLHSLGLSESEQGQITAN